MSLTPRLSTDVPSVAPERAPLGDAAPLPPAGAVVQPGASETIGQAGGIIRAGSCILVVPPFALDFPVTITLRPVGGSMVVEPEGLEFAVPACLVRGYGERAPQVSFLRTIHSDAARAEHDALPSLDTRFYEKVFGSLRCSSSHMAAE